MANTAGGVILLGIEENQQARAIAAPGVKVSDSEVGRIRQIVAAQVSPMPTFDIETILDNPEVPSVWTSGGGDSGSEIGSAHGFIMIAILRSPSAPHAVLVNQALRYPKRNGATTRYLSEPEVAAAYADRAAGAAEREKRIDEVEQEAFERIDREQMAWLIVSLVPDVPGDFPITTANFDEFMPATLLTNPAIVQYGVSLSRARVGRRRLLADGTLDNSPLARYASLELHTDGAGTYGLNLVNLNQRRPGLSASEPVQQILSDEAIVIVIISGLLRTAQHARDRTAASGNAVVRATLLPLPGADSTEIGYDRPHGHVESRTAEAVAAVDDLATPGMVLVATAAALADEIGQAFGIPEMGQLSRDGSVRRLHWGQEWQQQIVNWAGLNKINVSDDRLRQES
jgi:hypothetical protein